MDAFEYAVALVAIMIALAIGDMAMSLHKLIRWRRSIRWDARVLLAGALAFLTLFKMWFEFWSVQDVPEVRNFAFLLTLLIEISLLFLAAATVFPDEVTANSDLTTFYDETARSLWVLFALFEFSYLLHWLYFVFTRSAWSTITLGEDFIGPIPMVGALILAIWPQRRALHLWLVPAMIILRLLPSLERTIA